MKKKHFKFDYNFHRNYDANNDSEYKLISEYQNHLLSDSRPNSCLAGSYMLDAFSKQETQRWVETRK